MTVVQHYIWYGMIWYMFELRYEMTSRREGSCEAKNLEELETDITCPVCQEHYTDPKFLPCHHYYCKKCIIKLADKPVFNCPECRKETLLKDGVEGLQPAFFVHRMKSTYTAMKEMKELYDEKHGPAGNVMKESSTRPSTMSCLIHHAMLDIYCHHCKSFICKYCREIGHKTHKFQPTEEAASDKKKILLKKLNPLEEEVSRLSSALLEVVANKKEVEDQGKMAAHGVRGSFHELHQMLERREQQMLLNCEDIVKTKLERLCKQENDLYFGLVQTKTAIDHFKSLVGNSTNTEVLTQHSEVQHQISLKVQEHCKNKKTTAPVEEADLKVEVNMSQELQTLCQSNAKITTIPQCYLQIPHRNFCNEVSVATLTVPHPRKARSVSCRIKHLASKKETWCETERQRDDGTKYSVSYTPTDAGEHEITATVNGQDLSPHYFRVPPHFIGLYEKSVIRLIHGSDIM